MTGAAGAMAGRRILLVEDDYWIAQEMERSFRQHGAEVVGPAASVDAALDLIDAHGDLDGAVLDFNLLNETSRAIAEALARRGVPFVFATGYDRATIPAALGAVTLFEKPADPLGIARALFGA